MAGNVFNEKDSMEINELASLNEDISPELIEQLQLKISVDAKNLKGAGVDINDDSTLFEEPSDVTQKTQSNSEEEKETKKQDFHLDKNFDDNFIKKYKAKLQKQQNSEQQEAIDTSSISDVAFGNTELSNTSSSAEEIKEEEKKIDEISNGNITEKPLTLEQKNYNDSLDFLDGNVKYSKYVIYIDPKNVDFIESLTVKERKNLINKIIKEQDDIAITKQRFQLIQTVIRHAVVAILTITLSIPIIYYTINASLEASINNYRRSQTNFQTLYKEKGKIKLNNIN